MMNAGNTCYLRDAVQDQVDDCVGYVLHGKQPRYLVLPSRRTGPCKSVEEGCHRCQAAEVLPRYDGRTRTSTCGEQAVILRFEGGKLDEEEWKGEQMTVEKLFLSDFAGVA